MKGNLFFNLSVLLVFAISIGAQSSINSEEELKVKANELFLSDDFKEAKLLYAQLLSLYPKDPTYNYRYGACVLQTEADKSKPLKYLDFAASKPSVEPLAFYYLGRAYHLNYDFAKAVKQYSRFKNKAKAEEKEKYDVDRQIEMCKNGNNLLSKLNEVQVLERQEIAEKDFYRIYDENAIGGKLIVKPDEFKSKYDQKVGEKSIVFLSDDAKEVYYSSYGKKGENGKDIYKAVKLGNGEWSEGVSLGSSINTKYDEDFAFIKPDGRTLYFASKGHTSMGGYDIFRSVFDEATGQWTEPENLDFAFSSADDDILFVTDQAEITAYFASNRASEFGKMTVYKVLIDRAPAQLSVINGTFISESNASEKQAKITVIDKSTKQTIGVYNTDENGNYAIEIAKNGGEYQFSIETTPQAPIHTGIVSIPKQDEFEVLGQELRLVGVGDDQQLVIKNIFDGTAVNNLASTAGPKISSELIRMKANLDVNYSSNDLTAYQNSVTSEKNSENLVSEVPKAIENTIKKPEEVSVDENEELTNTSISEEAINGKLNQIKKLSNNNLEQKQNVVSAQYAAALGLQKEADQYFSEAEELKVNGAATVDVEIKEKEAGIKALKASYATQIAQRIEESMNEDLSNLDAIENVEVKIREMLVSDNLAEAELQLNNLQSRQKRSITAEEIIQEELSNVSENDRIADKKVSDFSAKNQSFNEEKAKLKQQINKLSADLEKASNGKKDEIKKSINATKLDLEDLDYQSAVLSKSLIEAQLTKKSLKAEKGELTASSSRLNTSGENGSSISEQEKDLLVAKLKEFREKDLLAYSSTNELYTKGVEVPTESILSDLNNTEPITNSESSVTDEPALASKELADKDYSNLSETSINSSYASQIESADAIEDVELKLASQIKVYADWLNDLNGKKAVTQSEYDAQIDESERSYLKKELDGLNTNIREKSQLKKELEEELAKRASGSFVAEATPINNINEVNESTVVEDKFTNLDFDQTYQVNNESSVLGLIEAKKKLYQAGQISQKEKLAQESAYTLATAEERTEAFAKANDLKKQSERTQLEAAELFAKFNLEEFRQNRMKINEANNFNGKYSTNSLELAELLSEEAQTFFTDAAIIRSEINEEDRLSQKEVKLQKAYDYEMLALKKQKEALKKLGLVVNEVVNNQLGNSAPAQKKREPFVQIITDKEVLAVVEATEANQKAETLSASVVTLNSEAEQQENQASLMDAGEERDSVLALAKDARAEADRKLTQAALLYERERQIQAGLVGVADVTTSPESKILPVKKASIYTQVAIDTVEISEERKNFLLSSQYFIDFANNRQSLGNQLSAANLSYNQALELAKENDRLRKEAIIETNKAKAVKGEEEKQRLIKSAQVIESEIEKNEQQIEDLNKAIKVKNFLVVTLEKKDNELMSKLSEKEKSEYASLSKDYVPSKLVATPIAQLPARASEESFTEELTAEETSENLQNLKELSPDNTELAAENTALDLEEANENASGFEALKAENSELAENNSTLDLPEGVVVDESEDVVLNDRPESELESSKETNSRVTTPETIAKKLVTGKSATITPEEASIREVVKNTPVKTIEKKPIENISPSVVNEVDKAPLKIENIDVVPRQVKQAIFITLNKEESAYSASNPIPTKTKMPEGIVYKVQIGAFRREIPPSTFTGFAPLMAEKTASGITRYTAGLFANENSAIQARNEIRGLGYPDAFVVAFLNGERIGISQARQKTGEVVRDNIAGNSSSTIDKNAPTASNVTKVKGGTKEALPASFSAPNVAEVVNVKTVEGLYYTVQIGVFSTPVKKGTFDYENLNVVELSNGLLRYNAGMFTSVIAAAELKNTVLSKVKDAFVTAYYNGERVSLTEATKLKKQ